MKNIIIGTAGHIDHGKTTLIKALTGRETDTLKEEKKRGISINLGFTYFDLPSGTRAGIVDVPGHEKFIKNMLAGASGIDIVLFVVSAEEGVMPQTVEHLDILSFLDVKKGLIILTKSDSVEDEFIELVKDEIIEKVKGTFLENAKIIEVDSISKRGINKLVNQIDDISDKVDEKDEKSPSRLNIDRVFSVKGFGTVITGTLLDGKISIDDELCIYPSNIKTKIRSIQVHGDDVETAYAGQRTAINISNVKVESINRGDVLASFNSLEETMMLDVKISLVNHINKSIKHWDRLRLYHGTREILCRIVPLDKDELKAGDDGYVQLRLEESIVSKKGDKIVLRSYSPVQTVGGGIIIDASSRKHKRFNNQVLEALKVKEKGDLKDILEEYLKSNRNLYASVKDFMSYTGDNKEDVENALNNLYIDKKMININNMFLHITAYDELKKRVTNTLFEYHKKYRLREGMLKEELRSKVESKFKTKDMDIFLSLLYEDKVIKLLNNKVAMYDFNVNFNSKQKEIKEIIKNKLMSCGLDTILTIEELELNNNYKEVLEVMIGESIIKLDDTYVIHKDVYNKALDYLVSYLNQYNEITLGEYRDLINSSRKNCMIILEHFDRNRITKRIDNKRILY